MLKSLLNLAAAAAVFAAAPALAQIQTIDPDRADPYPAETSDPYQANNQAPLDAWPSDTPAAPASEWGPVEAQPASSEWNPAEPAPADAVTAYPQAYDPTAYDAATADTQAYDTANTGRAQSEDAAADPAATPVETAAARPVDTVPREDVFTAAEDLFGRGAEGLAGILEDILRDQGEPTAYIAGQEASGAFVLGVRYGSGTMRHSVEGDRAVYWTGPSVGFDFGADASKVFVLVYNLHDSQDLFKRFPGAEGNAYILGGFTAQYMRRGDIVLIPIRLGVGLRLGVNAGYMRFSERNRWVPF